MYMYHARNGEKYDFKNKNVEQKGQLSFSQYHLRGMPLDGVVGVDGNAVFGSARDVGNYAAGFVAAASGLDWDQARLGFDLYESMKRSEIKSESMNTQSAQRIGYDAGINNRWTRKLYLNFTNLFN